MNLYSTLHVTQELQHSSTCRRKHQIKEY